MDLAKHVWRVQGGEHGGGGNDGGGQHGGGGDGGAGQHGGGGDGGCGHHEHDAHDGLRLQDRP